MHIPICFFTNKQNHLLTKSSLFVYPKHRKNGRQSIFFKQ